ncbi:hypothetical protein, partial [Desulfobacula sp.]|uniref:hypothetical protein n=1 Tax=Desulfobacula sp. TaxID=2593537 RepID=UPI0039B86A20
NAKKKYTGRYQQVCDRPGTGMLEHNPNLKMHRISPVILLFSSIIGTHHVHIPKKSYTKTSK